MFGHGLGVSGKSEGRKKEGRWKEEKQGWSHMKGATIQERQESNVISHTLAEVLTSDLQKGGLWVGSWEKVGSSLGYELKQGSSQA